MNPYLVHFSTTPGLTTLDPEFQGTAGRHSPETKHGKPTHPRVYFYEEGTPTESVVTGGAKSKYVVKHPGHDKIIDIANDLENQQQAKQQWLQKPIGSVQDAYFKLLKDKGYLGFKNSASGLPNVVAMFHATPVHAEIPMPKDMAANPDWTKAEVPMSLKKSQASSKHQAFIDAEKQAHAEEMSEFIDKNPDGSPLSAADIKHNNMWKKIYADDHQSNLNYFNKVAQAGQIDKLYDFLTQAEKMPNYEHINLFNKFGKDFHKATIADHNIDTNPFMNKIGTVNPRMWKILHKMKENELPPEELRHSVSASVEKIKGPAKVNEVLSEAKPDMRSKILAALRKEKLSKAKEGQKAIKVKGVTSKTQKPIEVDAIETKSGIKIPSSSWKSLNLPHDDWPVWQHNETAGHTKFYAKKDGSFISYKNQQALMGDMQQQASAFNSSKKLEKTNGTGVSGAGGATPPMMRPPVPAAPASMPMSKADESESRMAKKDLKDIMEYAQALDKMVVESEDLEDWVDSKITVARQYLSDIAHYLSYEHGKPTEELGKGDVIGMKTKKVISTDTKPASKTLVAKQPTQAVYKRGTELAIDSGWKGAAGKTGGKPDLSLVKSEDLEKGDVVSMKDRKVISTDTKPAPKELVAQQPKAAKNERALVQKVKSKWEGPRPEPVLNEKQLNHLVEEEPDTALKFHADKLNEGHLHAILNNKWGLGGELASVVAEKFANDSRLKPSHINSIMRWDSDAALDFLKHRLDGNHVQYLFARHPSEIAEDLHRNPNEKHIDAIVKKEPELAKKYLSDHPIYQSKYGNVQKSLQKPQPSLGLAKSDSKKAKFERCVLAVKKKSGDKVNPWAVCHASVDGAKKSEDLEKADMKVKEQEKPTKGMPQAKQLKADADLEKLKEGAENVAKAADKKKSELNKSGYFKEDKKTQLPKWHDPLKEQRESAAQEERELRPESKMHIWAMLEREKQQADKDKTQKPKEELEKGKNVRKQREAVFGGWKTSAGSPRREKQIAALTDMIKRRFGLEAKRAPGKVAASGKVIDKPNFHDNVVEHIGNPDSLVHEVGHLYQYGKDMESIDPRKEFKAKEQSLSDWQKDMDAHWGDINVKHGYKKQAQTAEEYEPTALENYYRRRAGLPTHQKTASTEEENKLAAEKQGKKYKKPEIPRTQAVDDPSKEIVQKVKVKGKDGKEKEIWLTGSMKNLTNKTRELVDQIDRGELMLDPTRGFVEGTSVDAKINRRARAASQDKTRKDADTLMRSDEVLEKKLILGEGKPSKATKKATPEEHKTIMDKLSTALDTVKVDTSPEATKERKMLLEHVKHKLKGQK